MARNASRHIPRLAIAALATLCVLFGHASLSQGDDVAPTLAHWGGDEIVIPSDGQLLDDMAGAYALRRRREYTRTLDALDPGELYEDATLSQLAIDRGIFGIDALFAVGDDLFELLFTTRVGLGNGLAGRSSVMAGDRPAPNLRRVQEGGFGGPDALGCSGCHSLGGLDGAGTQTQVALLGSDGDSALLADRRSPPHVLGLGAVERLATEMSEALAEIRDAARAEAAIAGAPVRRALEAKGVSFGFLRVEADGRLDTSEVEGVDADLVVRPFGWKGHRATIREMSREAFRTHLGIVSTYDQFLAAEGLIDPAEIGDGSTFDVDADGVDLEVDDGMVTTMVAYLAQLEVPAIRPPTSDAMLESFAEGSAQFDAIGCASCHRRSLRIYDPILTTRPETPTYADSDSVSFDISRDGEAPRVESAPGVDPGWDVPLFSDLRRHDMGDALATPAPFFGVPERVFLTRPLWGLAETAPYLHDGRAATIDAAIRLHGGEAEAARDAYLALSDEERAALRVFLGSLSRARRVLIP